MTNKAIIEAAKWALQRECYDHLSNEEARRLAREVLTAVTPLIQAATLEEAARVAEDYRMTSQVADVIAEDIRALKVQP